MDEEIADAFSRLQDSTKKEDRPNLDMIRKSYYRNQSLLQESAALLQESKRQFETSAYFLARLNTRQLLGRQHFVFLY